MDALRGARENRAGLSRLVTYGNDVVKRIVEILIEAFGPVMADVDPSLDHYLNGDWIDHRRARPGAEYVDSISGQVAQKTLSHL